jgi:hypothetical protein
MQRAPLGGELLGVLKQHQAIAMRCGETAYNLLGAIHLGASMIWLA